VFSILRITCNYDVSKLGKGGVVGGGKSVGSVDTRGRSQRGESEGAETVGENQHNKLILQHQKCTC
jgi:hypothetical protein